MFQALGIGSDHAFPLEKIQLIANTAFSSAHQTADDEVLVASLINCTQQVKAGARSFAIKLADDEPLEYTRDEFKDFLLNRCQSQITERTTSWDVQAEGLAQQFFDPVVCDGAGKAGHDEIQIHLLEFAVGAEELIQILEGSEAETMTQQEFVQTVNEWVANVKHKHPEKQATGDELSTEMLKAAEMLKDDMEQEMKMLEIELQNAKEEAVQAQALVAGKPWG